MQFQGPNALQHPVLFLMTIVVSWIAVSPEAEARVFVRLSQPILNLPLQVAQSPDPRKTEARRLLRQGAEQYQNSQFEAALRSWHQALNLYQEIQDRRGAGKSFNNLGLAYYAMGDYRKAIEYQQQSLEIAREFQDRQEEGQTLNNLGLAVYALGDYGKAIDYYRQSLVIAQEFKNQLGQGQSLGNLGLAYYAQGDYPKALQYQQQSLALFRLLNDRQLVGQSLGNLGLVYSALGEYEKATEYQQQWLAIARTMQDRASQGEALGNLGLVYFARQNYGQSIQYQQQSLALFRSLNDRLGESQALLGLGAAYYGSGDYRQAIEYQQQSLALFRSLNDRLGEGQALASLGVVYYQAGDYEKAIAYQQQSLVIFRALNNPLREGSTLNNIGIALFKSGQLADAERYLLQAIQVYESLRQGLRDSHKISIAETQRNPYNNLQQVFIAQNKVESALEIAERGRARAFVELLAQRAQGKKQFTSQPIQIATIKQIAREQNAILVEYANIYDEQLFIWVVHPTGKVDFRRVNLQPFKQQNGSLEDLIFASRRSIGVQDRNLTFQEVVPSNTAIRQDYSEFKQLYQVLIQPIQDLLPQNDPEQRVIFIPQGSLFFVSFAALQASDGRYLLEKHTIVTAPAIQVLELTRKQRQQLATSTHQGALVIGNPTMPKVKLKVGGVAQPLSSLPGAEKEAVAIAQLLQTTPLIGNLATEAAVSQAMVQARIIHLATHGLLYDFAGSRIPGAIALAPTDSNDGLLTAEDLLELPLKAELVVLSACDTGQGKITGDGVIGLSRSLITAGVPSVVVSLWAIPDSPTANLMTHFYQNLQQGQNKAQALRQAMLKTKQDFPDPKAWAAFTLIGEAE